MRLSALKIKFLIAFILLLDLSVLLGISYTKSAAIDVQHQEQNNVNIRAWHFVIRFVSIERARWMVDLAALAGFNTIVVSITDGIQLDNAPWKPLPNSWSKKQFRDWIYYSRSKGMSLIPELKLLTHQEKLFQNNFPDLMYNAVSYDPRKKQVYLQVFSLIDEIIELIQPKAIHIGHDEVVGWHLTHAKKLLREGEKMLPADLFINDILKIHAYLKNIDVETWMWGDMLISPDELPQMGYLQGKDKGYGKELRAKIPRDIVICDWRYFDKQIEFPSLDIMQKEGFRVIGATWKKEQTTKNYSYYAAKHNAYGMMATTWWHVQKEQWDIVENIIVRSGEIFSRDFQNVK